MIRPIVTLVSLAILLQCTAKKPTDNTDENGTSYSLIHEIVDSLYEAKSAKKLSNILPRRLPNLSRDSAYTIQSLLFAREFADTKAAQIGWKMGGTNAQDSTHYNQMYGYITTRSDIPKDSVLMLHGYPADVSAEAEVAFKIKKDLPNGAHDLDELRQAIDYVFGASEIISPTSIPLQGDSATLTVNQVLASNLAHQGIIQGDRHLPIEEFDLMGETVKCYINDELAAEGQAKNIYGNPLGVLLWLSNNLPKHGNYLRAGDIVITGSMYQNPVLNNTGIVRLEFSTLGNIEFQFTTE
jgi:2-keto-4-pentenoate hydratase